MVRPWVCSASSKSQTVVPSRTEPARVIAPEAASRVSTRWSCRSRPGPTSTTLRIRSGLLAPRSCPDALREPPLSAIAVPPARHRTVLGPRQLLFAPRAVRNGGARPSGDHARAPRTARWPGRRRGLALRAPDPSEGVRRSGPQRGTPRCMGSARGSCRHQGAPSESTIARRGDVTVCAEALVGLSARLAAMCRLEPARPRPAGPLHRRRLARGGGRRPARRDRPGRRLRAHRRRRRLDRRRRRRARRGRRRAGRAGRRPRRASAARSCARRSA